MLILFVALLVVSDAATPFVKLQSDLQPAQDQLSLLERCQRGTPIVTNVLLETLPGTGRAAGDPCSQDEQCASSLKCLCQAHGGKECTNACVAPNGDTFPGDGNWHAIACQFNCQCAGGLAQCLDLCPAVAVDCAAGHHPVEVPPPQGSCCSTWRCDPDIIVCEDDDVSIWALAKQGTVQSKAFDTAVVDVGLAAYCCNAIYSACGSKSFTPAWPWVISQDNYLKSSGYGSTAQISSLGLSLIDRSSLEAQPTSQLLGRDLATVVVQGGGYCGEGRITKDPSTDCGVYCSNAHTGVHFTYPALSQADMSRWCDSIPVCVGWTVNSAGVGALRSTDCRKNGSGGDSWYPKGNQS